MAILLDVDKPPMVIAPGDGRTAFSLEELQMLVGGYIELVRVPNPKNLWFLRNTWMIVNEEGRLLGLPQNMAASQLAGQPIMGHAAVVSFKEMEGREPWEPEEVEEEQ
jgi:hypothetical protein